MWVYNISVEFVLFWIFLSHPFTTVFVDALYMHHEMLAENMHLSHGCKLDRTDRPRVSFGRLCSGSYWHHVLAQQSMIQVIQIFKFTRDLHFLRIPRGGKVLA